MHIVFWGFVGVFALLILFAVYEMFSILVASLFLYLVLVWFEDILEKLGLSKKLSLAIIVLGFLLLLGLIFGFFLPKAFSQSVELLKNYHDYQLIAYEKINAFYSKYSSLLPPLELADLQEKLLGISKKIISSFGNILSVAINWFSFLLLAPMITFMLLYDRKMIFKYIASIVPNRQFEAFLLISFKIMNSLKSYVKGQFIDAMFMGFATAIGLLIIGFPFWALIGIVAGLGNLIPYFGVLISIIPTAFIIFTNPDWFSITGIGLVVSVFVVVQILEGFLVYPIAVGKSVKLHPLIIIIALTVAGQSFGILGMIVVVPLVSLLKVTIGVLQEYTRRNR